MSLIKKAKLEIAKAVNKQKLPPEVIELILEAFVNEIRLTGLVNENANLQQVIKDLQNEETTKDIEDEKGEEVDYVVGENDE